MKKILIIFLILAFIPSFFIVYSQTTEKEFEKMEKAGEDIGKPFIIPNNPLFSNPNEMYPILCEAANEHKVNIFRTNICYKANNQVEILKYVLLTSNTRFFDAFRLKSGRLLTAKDTQDSNAFISTVDTGDHNQIGIIREFGSSKLITIKPLKTAYEYLPVDGRYFVEASDNQVYAAFIKDFVNKVNKYYQQSYSAKYFQEASNSGAGLQVTTLIDYLKYINYAIFLTTLILLIYYIFYESKRIGIMKMHGLSNIRLWFIICGKLITIIFILTAAVSLLVALIIKDTTSQFVGSVIIFQFKAYLIMMAISIIPYIYISRIKISDAIKNRKDTNGIFTINMLLKMGCSILAVMVGLSIFSQYAEIRTKQENLKNWEQSKDYGIFYPVNIGNDIEDVQQGSRKETAIEAVELYPVLNKMGAVLIDALSYEERALLMNKGTDNIRSIKVNPNYLQRFPVYDLHNQPVHISEDTCDWILLVPEKYYNRENEIMNYFHKDRIDAYDAEEHCFGRLVPDSVKNQHIKIIWLTNNQKIFSFNPKVFPAENNMIIDPIIQVITEKNSICADRVNLINGHGGSDPLKVKLINRDTALTLRMLESELKRLKLDDNLQQLITVDQYVLQQIYDLQKWMNHLLLIIMGLIVGLLILMVQNLTIFFNKYQQKFIVRRLFGTGFFRTYKEYILLFTLTWIFQLLICLIVKPNGADDIKLLALAAGIILIEVAASVIALLVIEQKNKVKILKGGI
ncbi:DUF1430 domain-containing protein [Aceticella autotrophica]|uniref:DUF1430 domain-containing protein n=1 Tax=Aceticella autotrophica TaxID=2755338 RepID=A0A975AWB0_9THEO|nr:DUF1430 domain-containing protein [Aceticella autotrophica]QSZ27661.1 DUF1430 domain-containing protein [Aceticella autotrophica]